MSFLMSFWDMDRLLWVAMRLGALAGLAFLFFCIGKRLFRNLAFDSPWEEAAFSIGLGMGVVAGLIFFLGLAGWLTPGVALLGLLILFAFSGSVLMELAHRLAMLYRGTSLFRGVSGLAVLSGVLLVFSPLGVMPFYPPVAWDSTSFHLALAKIYAHNGAIVFTPYLRYPVSPQLNEMLFTLALLFDDDIMAQLIQWLMMLTIGMGLMGWMQRQGMRSGGLWAAALWMGNPLVLFLGSTGYIDMGLTLFVFLSLWACQNALRASSLRWSLVSGVFMGFALGTKYPALVYFLAIGGVMAWQAIRYRRVGWLGLYLMAALLIAGPWYWRNAVYAGDPFFPMGSTLFGYGLWNDADTDSQIGEMLSYGLPRTTASLLTLPWRLAVEQFHFKPDAELGLALRWAILPGLLWGWWDRRFRFVAAAVTGSLIAWFFSAQVLRYLLPIVPLLALLAAGLLSRILLREAGMPSRWWRGALLIGLALLAVWPGWKYALDGQVRLGKIPVTAAERRIFLERHLPPAFQALTFLNEKKGWAYAVYVLLDSNMAYFADGVFMGDWYGPARYSRVRDALGQPERLYREVRALNAQYLTVPKELGSEIVTPLESTGLFRVVFFNEGVTLYEMVKGLQPP